MERVLIHADQDCFYASVEILHHPLLRGKPVAVAGDPEARHGIILTKSYEAKRCGVKTAYGAHLKMVSEEKNID